MLEVFLGADHVRPGAGLLASFLQHIPAGPYVLSSLLSLLSSLHHFFS